MNDIQFPLVAGLFLLFALSRAFLRYRDSSISFRQFLFWAVVWIGAGFFILYPNYSGAFADRLGLDRGTDFIVYSSIIVLYYLIFRMYAAAGSAQHDVTRLVRELAIKEVRRGTRK